MAKKYRNNGPDFQDLNRKLIPYNIIIMIVSLVCVISLIFGTFFTATVKVALTEELINKVLPDKSNSVREDGGQETGGGINIDNIIANIDWSVLEGEEVSLSIKIPTLKLIESATKDAKDAVYLLLDDVIENTVAQAMEMLPNLVSSLVSAMAKPIVTEVIKEVVTTEMLEELGIDLEITDEIIEELIENINFEKVTEVIDTILSPDSGKEEIAESIVELIDEHLDVVEELFDVSPEEIESIKEYLDENVLEIVDEFLDEFADEDGNISLDTILNSILSGLGEGGNILPQARTFGDPIVLASNSQPNAREGGSTEDLVNQLISDLLADFDDVIVENAKTIQYAIYGVVGFIALVAFAWLLLFVKTLVRTLSAKKTVGTKFVQIVGWIPFSLLVIAPLLTLWILKILNVFVLPAGIAISLMSFTIVSFIGAVVIMLLNIFGYSKYKRRVVKYQRANSDDDF